MISGRPFDFKDFEKIVNHTYFRQIINKLGSIIIRENKSDKAYYRLHGLYTDKKLTQWYTDVSENNRIFGTLDQLLSLLKHREGMMHNIRVDSKSDGIYQSALKAGFKPNIDNSKIILELKDNPLIESYIEPTISITTKDTIEFIIGCTFNPVSYSPSGFAKLFDILGQLKVILRMNVGNDFQLEPVSNMHFRYFHFNRDSLEYSFPRGYTLDLVYEHTHIYHKKLKNQKSVIRGEISKMPNTQLIEEAKQSFNVEFTKASDLL